MRDAIRLQEFWFEIRGQMSEVEPEAKNEVGSPLTQGNFADDAEPAISQCRVGDFNPKGSGESSRRSERSEDLRLE